MELTQAANPEDGEQSAQSTESANLTNELQDILDTATEAREHQAHYEAKAKSVGKHIDSDPDTVAAYFNIDRSTAEGAISDAELMRPEIRIAHRMSADTLDKILVEKKFKSYEETGYSAGAAGEVSDSASGTSEYRGIRQRYELANNLRDAGDPPLIHGYLEDLGTLGERGKSTSSYGEIEAILKPSVLDRSVYTDGDSARTNYAPIDLDTANIAARVQDRGHQRFQRNIRGDLYTEAIIMGGVTLDDVDKFAIDMTATQTMEQTEVLIEKIKAAEPSIEVIIRIPGEAVVPTPKILELAQRYPDAQFMITVRESEARGITSPFIALGAESVADQPQQEVDVRTQYEYEQAATRRDTLQQKAHDRWNKANPGTSFPANVSYHITNPRY